MEGLEIKEKKLYEALYNKDFRIDSSFYTKEPKKNPNLIYAKIGEYLNSSQYGISIEMNTDSVGYPIYRMNEIHDMLCDLDADKYADITQADFNKFALKDGDVLFNRTNSFEWVGRTGVYYQNDDIQRTFASYLVRLNPKDGILSEYLCAYLSCKYGEWDVKRRARQSINQTNVNPEEVKEIEIPLLDINLQQKVRDCFTQANSLRILSQKAYSDAELILHNELGTNAIAVADVNVSQKRFSDFVDSGRLDAEYYQPKYNILKDKLKSYKYGYYNLSEIAKTYRGDLISDTLYTTDNTGVAYIRGADISSNILTSEKCVYIDRTFIATKEIRCKTNDLVFALIGSVGTVARVTDNFSGSFISNNLGLIRLNSDADISAEYLHLLLTSPQIGKWLFEQKEMKTAQPKISDKDIFDFIIPKLDREIQQQIVNKVNKSFALRKESHRLLNLAKTMVETTIEKGENVAMKLLNIE